jgi:hypothetical protein
MERPPRREDYSDIRAFIRDWERYWDQVKPTPSAILRRADMVANDAALAIDMQLARIRDGFRSKDPDTVWNVFIDIEFLISSLWKMRLAGKLALSVTGRSWTALRDFDVAVPNLKLMRDVMQHLDEYGRDGGTRRHFNPRTGQLIGRRYLHSQISFSDKSFNWLGGALDFDQAHNASLQLLSAIRKARADTGEN